VTESHYLSGVGECEARSGCTLWQSRFGLKADIQVNCFCSNRPLLLAGWDDASDLKSRRFFDGYSQCGPQVAPGCCCAALLDRTFDGAGGGSDGTSRRTLPQLVSRLATAVEEGMSKVN
jgi:hypothetical protein